MKRHLLACLASALLVACGANQNESDSTDAGSVQPDAATPLDAGANLSDAGTETNPAECGVEASLGTITDFTLTGSYYGTDEGGTWVQGNFAYNDDRDVIVLELNPGKGAFTGPLAPGTYPLAGDDLNYATCGLCVLLTADSFTGPTYFATGGSVTLTSVSGRLTGKLEDVTFAHVDIDETTYVSTPVGDGCRAALDEMAFDDELIPNE